VWKDLYRFSGFVSSVNSYVLTHARRMR
jgi:hypothetical protein